MHHGRTRAQKVLFKVQLWSSFVVFAKCPAVQFWARCQLRREKQRRTWIYLSESGCIGMEWSREPADCSIYNTARSFFNCNFHLLLIHNNLREEMLWNVILSLIFLSCIMRKNATKTCTPKTQFSLECVFKNNNESSTHLLSWALSWLKKPLIRKMSPWPKALPTVEGSEG